MEARESPRSLCRIMLHSNPPLTSSLDCVVSVTVSSHTLPKPSGLELCLSTPQGCVFYLINVMCVYNMDGSVGLSVFAFPVTLLLSHYWCPGIHTSSRWSCCKFLLILGCNLDPPLELGATYSPRLLVTTVLLLVLHDDLQVHPCGHRWQIPPFRAGLRSAVYIKHVFLICLWDSRRFCSFLCCKGWSNSQQTSIVYLGCALSDPVSLSLPPSVPPSPPYF